MCRGQALAAVDSTAAEVKSLEVELANDIEGVRQATGMDQAPEDLPSLASAKESVAILEQ